MSKKINFVNTNKNYFIYARNSFGKAPASDFPPIFGPGSQNDQINRL
jgi:hypothetical protein